MEKVLYEYTEEFSYYLIFLIAPVVGTAFLIYSIHLFRRKKKGFVNTLFKISGPIVFLAAVTIFVNAVYTYHTLLCSHTRQMIDNGEYKTVEGYVENFYYSSRFSHQDGPEHFEVNGVYFEYDGSIGSDGYNKTASHGGVVRKDGQYLKIRYIPDLQTGQNKIVYISEIPQENDLVQNNDRIRPKG